MLDRQTFCPGQVARLVDACGRSRAPDLVWVLRLSVAEFVRIPVERSSESEFSRIPLRKTTFRPIQVVRPLSMATEEMIGRVILPVRRVSTLSPDFGTPCGT